MRLAIIGATGVVGREILEVLSERNFPLTELILVASEKSLGESIIFNERPYAIISLNELLEKNIDLALFSAGSDVSKIWAPKLADKGAKVIDNSSFWRMSNEHKLIVPEINGKELTIEDKIIANPNCSTIQLVMALAPLHKKFIVKRVIISTYHVPSQKVCSRSNTTFSLGIGGIALAMASKESLENLLGSFTIFFDHV